MEKDAFEKKNSKEAKYMAKSTHNFWSVDDERWGSFFDAMDSIDGSMDFIQKDFGPPFSMVVPRSYLRHLVNLLGIFQFPFVVSIFINLFDGGLYCEFIRNFLLYSHW